MVTAHEPRSLQEAILHFADFENCKREVMAMRWPDGVVSCPTCGSTRVTYLANARVWKCYEGHARAKFSLKVGTIFEDSPLPLEKWLPALWMVTNCKNGISSYELGRALLITQKSAWFMLSRLRLALQSKDGGKLGGEVEIDETFIGGKARNMHKDKKERIQAGNHRGVYGKVAVMGLLERHPVKGRSKVRTEIVPNTRRSQLRPQIDKNVEPGTTVHTDSLSSYRTLQDAYNHNVIDHAECYAKGNVHTNGLENFWSLLKRTIKGTYVSVEPFHLFRYLDEQAFRFNEREGNDALRFKLALAGVLGRRVTYAQLTAKGEERC
jgi:transposase-like protein